MSIHRFPVQPPAEAVIVSEVESRTGRTPAAIRYDADGLVLTYDPDLTAQQVAALDAYVAAHLAAQRTRDAMTTGEYEAIADSIATLRQFRQTTPAEFAALTAAQRDAALFDATQALIDVIRTLLRD